MVVGSGVQHKTSDDFLSSDEGKTILAMSTMKFLMKQDSSTIDSVVHTFKLSPGQKSFLLGARRGEGLFATKTWTQMQVMASPLETEMANTTLISQAQAQQQKAFQEQDLKQALALKNGLTSNAMTIAGQEVIVNSSVTHLISEGRSNKRL